MDNRKLENKLVFEARNQALKGKSPKRYYLQKVFEYSLKGIKLNVSRAAFLKD